ncbi:MAG: SGNH/GDSL hydrolase family protein [Clostridium sp.]|nr:SGNH/GDSL hydrolase family protein [Clostridium sp.]
MKTKTLCALIAWLAIFPMGALANGAKEETPWAEIDAMDLRIVNQGFKDTERPYARLPKWLKDSVRPTLWDRQECSAGIAVRFATDSKRIGVKYNLFTNAHMAHMADTGIKGTDLYIFEGDSAWRHVNTNRPYLKDKDTKLCEATYVENLDGKTHEYMVYLPLYDGIDNLKIKIDSGATITAGRLDLIPPKNRIVAYGTSIMQGGCASRTGMSPTAIMSRELNREIINLGFSGEGKQDECVARVMAQIPDVDIFLIDPVPNCTEMQCDTLTYGFIKTLRTLRPEAKIVMVEGPMYPYSRYDSFFGNYLPKKNAAYRRNYERLIAEDPRNLYYVTSEGLDGPEDDGTVDGIHLTDLGFRHYADKIGPVLRGLLSPEE